MSYFSEDALERFREKDNRVHNSIARENPEEPLFEALSNYSGSYGEARFDGKSIDEIFKDMLAKV
jgi:hypothetical protein